MKLLKLKLSLLLTKPCHYSPNILSVSPNFDKAISVVRIIMIFRLLLIAVILLHTGIPFAQTDTTSWYPKFVFECESNPYSIFKSIKIIGNLEDRYMLFSVYNRGEAMTEIWVTDGQKENTRLAGKIKGDRALKLLGKINDMYVLTHWSEIYLLDVDKDKIEPMYIIINDIQVYFEKIEIVNNRIFFAHEGCMYYTNGTNEGTFRFSDSRTEHQKQFFGRFPESYWATQRQFMFLSYYGNLWVSDGTEEGTYILGSPTMRFNECNFEASTNRILLRNSEGAIISSDGTLDGTYPLGIDQEIENLDIRLKQLCFFDDELYWTDYETSTIYKFSDKLRLKVPVCEKDSITLNGGFDVIDDQIHWCSDVDHFQNYSIKINLNTCERTSDFIGKKMESVDYYVVNDSDSLFVYANTAGKRKTPLPYLVHRNKQNSEIQPTHGNMCHTSDLNNESYLISVADVSQMWIVQPQKNNFRPIRCKTDENQMRGGMHHSCGDQVFFIYRIKNREFISVIQL